MPTETAAQPHSENEVDAGFRHRHETGKRPEDVRTPRYDFLRPNRIPASQLRAIRLLFDNFARGLASSLSAYLRSYITVNLVSFEQVALHEFIDGLPSPTIIGCLSLRPYDGPAVLEISPACFFPILEMLLGGNGKAPRVLTREITDIEQRLVEMLLRVIVQDLREAWKMIATVEFTIQNIEKQPQFLQILAPTEAVIAIGMEICAGDAKGSLNIAIPSLAVKMMHQNFDQQWIKRRTEPTLQEQQRMLQLLEPVRTDVEIAHDGATIRMQDLLSLAGGDLVVFDLPVEKPLSCLVNGKDHYRGHMAQFGGKCLFVVDGASING
jgi:flagellar motor switch protein FliM